MTVTIDVQDSNGDTLTTLELFDDVYARLVTEAAINGVDINEHIITIITGHAQDIIDGME